MFYRGIPTAYDCLCIKYGEHIASYQSHRQYTYDYLYWVSVLFFWATFYSVDSRNNSYLTIQRTNLIYAKSNNPTVKIANSNNPAAIDPIVSDLILAFMMFGFKYNANL